MTFFAILRCAGVALALAALLLPAKAATTPFAATIVDSQTGRGVPLAELKTVNDIDFFSDSAGIVAIDEPDLMGRNVYFSISSPGYAFPKDKFGNSGLTLDLRPGGSAKIEMQRVNIAQRLYRMTGGGIYEDSEQLGLPSPIAHPLLDGNVFGQDTVEPAVYKGKIYWFFGDTNRPSYPLGQFATSGATSLLPASGGLDPSVGVNLQYWVGADGFSRPMIPLPHPPGPIWVGGVFTLGTGAGEHLYTHYAEINPNSTTAIDGLAVFDDSTAAFQSICVYPAGTELRPEGHPFVATGQGETYLYFEPPTGGPFPLIRVRPVLTAIETPAEYEGFTCLQPGATFQGASTKLERDADGKLVWAWKPNTPALSPSQEDELVHDSKMSSSEELFAPHDVITDQPVIIANGSVFWNSYVRRWIMIGTQQFGTPSFLGEEWFAEATSPTGPWEYAQKIATHGGYTFYNPTQLPFFDEKGGKIIYFQGTYTTTYAGKIPATPRYNYNQLMYSLDLSDPRLSLPEPIYRWRTKLGKVRYGTEAELTDDPFANFPEEIFCAIAPDRPAPGEIPVYGLIDGDGDEELSVTAKQQNSHPLFYALPAQGAKAAPDVVPISASANSTTLGIIKAGQSPEPLVATGGLGSPPLFRAWLAHQSYIASQQMSVAEKPTW